MPTKAQSRRSPASTSRRRHPVEYPGWARRDVWTVGSLDPADIGLADDAFGTSSGAFLSTLMRRMDAPIASRWAHIALRDALLARVRAPAQVNPVDWVAERAWLLLRMGEADAARMLVAGVNTDKFTPKMVQVGVQSALATADTPALCPLQDGIRQYDKNIRQLVQAMCASLAGEPESAGAQIDQARRYGRIGGIDLVLAEKVVGAAGNTRSVTVEWEPVETLTAWRFGLAAGPGLLPPDRLINGASPQLRAFQARAPLLTAQQRLPSAFVAAGLGVFSSQTMVDLYSAIYDSTDPDDLPASDAWQLRQAYVAKDDTARMDAIRKLLALGKDPLGKEAARALAARAATLVAPDAELAKDAPELISAMLAGGFDEAAARWIPAVNSMDSADADRCWAMLALAAPNIAEVGSGRISAFIRRDKSPDKVRSGLLLAGLAGFGRISQDTANSLNRRYGLGLGRTSSWTRIIDQAGGTPPARHGADPDRHRLSDEQHRPPSLGPRLSCDHGAEAHRPGLHRADDRRRGPFPDVNAARTRALVDRFLDMMAAEAGASRHTLAAYRNDLERAAEATGSLASASADDLSRLGTPWAELAPSTVARRAAALAPLLRVPRRRRASRATIPPAALPRPRFERPLPRILDEAEVAAHVRSRRGPGRERRGGGAAQPRSARTALRLGAARERAGRLAPRLGAARPAVPDGARQGRQGTAGADLLAGAARGRGVDCASRPAGASGCSRAASRI